MPDVSEALDGARDDEVALWRQVSVESVRCSIERGDLAVDRPGVAASAGSTIGRRRLGRRASQKPDRVLLRVALQAFAAERRDNAGGEFVVSPGGRQSGVGLRVDAEDAIGEPRMIYRALTVPMLDWLTARPLVCSRSTRFG